MIALQYRLHELYDDKTRRALIDDMLTHYAADSDLVAFLRAADAAIGAASDDAQEDIKRLEEEVSCLKDERNDLETTVAELRDDLEYWQGRAGE
jgi:predicted nuclease with TOPRIM domain